MPLLQRLDTIVPTVGEHAYRQLTELYRALRLYVNCYQPSMKLLAKQGDGKKVRYVYDSAKTPLQRLFLSGLLPAQKQQELLKAAHALDPICLFQQVEQLQRAGAEKTGPELAAYPQRPLCGRVGADHLLVDDQPGTEQWRHFPGAATSLSRSLSALTNPHSSERHP